MLICDVSLQSNNNVIIDTMKTLADFKRRIQTGVKIHTVWNNRGQLIDRGVREIKTVQSNSFSILTEKEGKQVESWVNYPKASEIQFEGETANIFQDGKIILTYTFI